jgi:ribonuclease D
MQEPLIFDFERKPCVTVPDLTDEHLKIAARNGVAAIDIETSGLDWKSERIGLCQIFVPNAPPALVKSKKNARPEKLLELLHDPSIRKIFHHAMFDLRFLGHHWGARPSNIACTKIASKLIDPDQARGHSLAMILDKYLNVKIDKSERQSDWLTWDLSDSQVAYASTDVIYLPQLLESLMMRLESKSRAGLAQRCFDHIPTRVELEINGFADVYQY